MSLPEEFQSQLNSKVTRINVLQKLVLQERTNLGAKALGTLAKSEIDIINEEVRQFLLGLLADELGELKDDAAKDPFQSVGISMTPEKARALDALLERMTAPKVMRAADSEPDPTPASQPAPAVMRSPSGQRVLSPVLSALKNAAGGEDEWSKLPPEERARRVKEMERSASITYTPSK